MKNPGGSGFEKNCNLAQDICNFVGLGPNSAENSFY